MIDNETLEEEGPSLDESEEESSGSESSSLIRKVLWDSDLSETLDPIGKEYIPYTNQFISKAISDDIEANGVIIRDEYYEITVTGYTTSGFSDLGLLTPGGVIQQNSKDPQYGYLTDKPATVTAIFRPNSQTATMNSGETKVCFYDCFYEYGIRNEICLSHLTVVVYRNSDLQTTTTTSTTMPQVPGINKTLIYNIDFEEENAGTVLKQNGALVGEVVEWPAGSGNHALKYIMDSTTYKTTGVHPYIIPSGLSEVMAIQGEIPDGGEIRFSIDVGCDEPLQTGNPEYGTYMYAEMITADDGENYFRYNRTFIPGVGSFKTGEFSLSNYEVTPVAGTDNGRIALFDDGTLGAGMQGSAIYYDNIKLEWYGDWTPTNDCLLTYLYTREPIAHSDVNDAYTGNPFELPDIEAHKLATIKLWSGRVLDTVTFSNHRAVLENDSINEAIQNDIVVNGHIANDEHYLICTTARWKEDGGYVVPGFVTGDYEFWGDVDEDADYKYIGEEPYYDYGHFCSSSKEDQDGNCCAEKMTTASKLAFFSIDDENNNTLYISDITIYVYRNAYSLYRNKYNLTEPSQSNITTMSTESTTAIASTSSPKPLYGDNLIINADCFESDSSSPAFGWNVLSGDVRIDGSMMIYNDGVTSSKISVGLREAIKPNTEYMFDVESVSGEGAQLVVNGLEGEYSRTYFGVGDGPVCFKTSQDTSAVSFMVYVEAFAGATDTIVLDNFVLSEILNGENSEESESEIETSTTSTTTSTTSSTSTTTSTISTTSTTTTTTSTTEPTTSITSTIITTSTMPITKMSDTTIVTTSTGTENGGGDESTESFESEPDMILGDATGDGSVDMKDVLMIRKALAGISDIKNSVCADANKDGSLDMKDVLLVRKYLAHMVEL